VKEQLGVTERQLLTCQARAIVHMRQQIALNRFGLCLGAGVSKDFGFPMWGELIARIAHDPAVDGAELIGPRAAPSQSSRTQVLYQRFRSRHLTGTTEALMSADQQRDTRQAWTELVHPCLYQGITTDDQALTHPYLTEFLPIIRNAPLTVNYNFDDSLERLLSATRTGKEKHEGRGFETSWRPSTQFRSTRSVIYHPNGFLPLRLVEGFSEHLVFSEDSFADQLIASMAGHYSILLSHLSRTTCLLLGLSLEDATFKHLLRQNARQNPGHYHYYVAYVDDKKGRHHPSSRQP
jgi:SIR2-like domain